MTFTLIFTEQYNRRAARFLKRHPDLEKQYLKTLQLLEMNPHHPSLRLRRPERQVTRAAFGFNQSLISHHAGIVDPRRGDHPDQCRRS